MMIARNGAALRTLRALARPPALRSRAPGRRRLASHQTPPPAARTEPPSGSSSSRRITIADIRERRARAGRLVAGTAAYSDSDMFKVPAADKPQARSWDHLLSAESASRGPCVLKQAAAKHLTQPGLISLGGGSRTRSTSRSRSCA